MNLKIIVVFLAIITGVAIAAPNGKIIDTFVVNIDDSYAGSENEFIELGTNNIGNIIVVNSTGTDLLACIYAASVGNCTDDMLIPANSFRSKSSNYIRGLLLRSAAATITSVTNVEGSGE